MIWQNPWGWAGLLALGVPVLVHLLSRRRAVVQKFPTLRFLDLSRLTPTRRTRLSDILLLLVRLAIVGAAVGALAQPLILTANRTHGLSHTIARAIIVDTSASMLRATPAGERASNAAFREAQREADGVSAAVILRSVAPARMLAGAADWLATQPGTREIVIVSDFQLGAIDSVDLAMVPPEIGLRLARIDIAPATAPIEARMRSAGFEMVEHITPAPDRTDVEWTARRGPSTEEKGGTLLLLAGAAERAAADAAEFAAAQVRELPANLVDRTIPVADTDRSIAIVYPQFEQRAELIRGARPLDQPWMASVAESLRRDSTLVAAAMNESEPSAAGIEQRLDSAPFLDVAPSGSGRAVAVAARGSYGGRDRLLVFIRTNAGSLTSASLILGALQAGSTDPPLSELEPARLSDVVLQRWQRPAAPARRAPGFDPAGASDGRWLWVLALLLLAAETWIRRSARESPVIEVAHERVA